MAEHDPQNPVDPPHDPEHQHPAEQLDEQPADPRRRRREARERARELEEQAAAARAAAEQARLEAEQDGSASDDDEEEDEEYADPADEEDEDDQRVPSIPKGALKLPTFDGGPGMEKYAASFLEELDSYCEFYRVPGKSRISLLYTCFPLLTPSRSWFQDCKRRGLFTSYAKFKRLFKDHYGMNPAHSFIQIRKLEQLRQGNKSINAFYTDLTQAYSDLSLIGVQYSMHQKVTRFVTGMHPPLRKKVEEQMSSLMSLGIKSHFDLSAVYNMAFAQERTLGAIAAEERKSTNPTHPIEANTMRSNIMCKFCMKPGHLFDDCPKIIAKKKAGDWDYSRRNKTYDPLHKNTDKPDN